MRKTLTCVLLTFVLTACAGNAPPDTQVAHYSGTVLAAATELQKGITAATDAKVLPVPVAQQLTSYVEVVWQKSGPLLEALKSYHAVTALDLKKLRAGEINTMIAAINGALGQVLGTSIPEGALKQITLLVGNVMTAVGAIQAEIAKGLGAALLQRTPLLTA